MTNNRDCYCATIFSLNVVENQRQNKRGAYLCSSYEFCTKAGEA